MSKVYFLLFVLSLSVSSISAQEAKQELSLTNSSVKEKFNYLMINSNNYQDFKVVKKSWLSTVKRQVLDSLEKQVVKERTNDASFFLPFTLP